MLGRPREGLALRTTLVFILALVVPSVLLSAFAYQAAAAERRARLAERSRAVRTEALGLVGEVDALLGTWARGLSADLRAAGPARAPEQAVAAIARRVATDRLFRPTFLVLDRTGQRVHPAPPARATSGRSPPRAVAVALGGLAGAALPVDAHELLEAAERQPDAELAVRTLEVVFRRGAPAARAAALYELGRRFEASDNLVGMLNALDAYGELARLPIWATDLRGRPAAALGRFRLALVRHTLSDREGYLAALRALLDELEQGAPRLAAEAVSDLAARAAGLLEAEGQPARARAQELAQRRALLEAACVRLEDLFAPHLAAALPARGGVPRPGGGDPGLLAGAATGGEVGPPVRYARAWSGTRYEVVVIAPILGAPPALGGAAPAADGAEAPAVGLCAVQCDLDELERAVRARALLRGPSCVLVPSAEVAALARDAGASDAGVAVEPLRAPLDHVAVRLSLPDAGEDDDALALPRESVQVWAFALSIAAIAAGVLVTMRTVRREAKAAQLKSDFVANVTHELKTPLTSIRMFLDTLLLGRVHDEAEAKECLQVMAREAERLTRLIEQLLVFSRIEGKKWRLRLGFEDPRELVREALRILADQLGRTVDELGIDVVVVQDLPRIAVDRFAVVEAILNLLHNAWKYSAGPERKVRVVLSQRRRHVEVAVEDNGIGVPRRDRRRIFVKFERGTNAEEQRIEGSGIGLTLALSIAQAHGGTITHAPLKPRGSRFSVWLRT